MTWDNVTHETATEFWKKEEKECNCWLHRDKSIKYDYDIQDTHKEQNGTHSVFDLIEFEKGVSPT